MVRLVGEDLSDREYGIGYAGFLLLDPVPVKGTYELDHGERGVLAIGPRRGAGMAVAAHAAGIGKANVAANHGRDADRQSLAHQHRTLLDVKLQESARVAGRDPRCGRCPQRLHIHIDLRHVLGQRAAAVAPSQAVELLERQVADRETAAEVGDAEPHALLAADTDRGDVAGRRGVAIAEGGKGREAGDYPGEAIVMAARRYRVEV